MRFWHSRSPRTLSVYAGLLSTVLLFAAASLGAPVFDRLSLLVFDQYQKMKPRAPGGAPVLIVDIDEASIEEIGQWPWPRSQLALMVDRLGQLGAAVIAFDMTFSEPDRTSLDKTLAELRAAGAEIAFPDGTPELDNDAIFERTLARNPTVAGFAFDNQLAADIPEPKSGYAFGGADAREILEDKTGALTNLPAFDAAASGIGFFSLPPEVDGIVRKVPLIESAKGGVHLSLGLETLRVGQGAANIVVRSTGASGEIDSGIPAIVDVRVGDAIVPTDARGNLLLYYSGRTTDKTLSARELLVETIDLDALAERVAGHIVLIGTSALGPARPAFDAAACGDARGHDPRRAHRPDLVADLPQAARLHEGRRISGCRPRHHPADRHGAAGPAVRQRDPGTGAAGLHRGRVLVPVRHAAPAGRSAAAGAGRGAGVHHRHHCPVPEQRAGKSASSVAPSGTTWRRPW